VLSGGVMSQALSSFLNMFYVVLFAYKFRISFSIPTKKSTEILIRIALNLQIKLFENLTSLRCGLLKSMNKEFIDFLMSSLISEIF
jgi:hypothetical protein